MPILVLDWERDPVWENGVSIEEKYLKVIRLSHEIHESDISEIEFDDGTLLRCLWINRHLIITTQEVDINVLGMRIKDAIGGEKKITGASNAQQFFKSAILGQKERECYQREVKLVETITDQSQGIITGMAKGQLRFKNMENYLVQVRPNTKVFHEEDYLLIDLDNDYYEQVKYSIVNVSPPCKIEHTVEGKELTLKLMNILETIELENIILRIPMIKAVEMKKIEPNNLLQKCTIDPEDGMCWSVLSLRPRDSIKLQVMIQDTIHERISGFLILEHSPMHPDISFNSEPLPVLRKYDKSPWFSTPYVSEKMVSSEVSNS
jgi:hypothetical protein